MRKNKRVWQNIILSAFLISAVLPISANAAEKPTKIDFANYDEVSPENLVIINTTKGEIIIALEPRIAPNHVNRIRELVSESFYDGIIFHRVIDGFMDQTGDPTGTGVGSSTKPDLNGEFMYRRNEKSEFTFGNEKEGVVSGWVGVVPVTTQTDALMSRTIDGSVKAWGKHCPAVTSMARSDDPNSANSQFFLMRKYTQTLDQKYSVWGYVVKGLDVVRSIKVVEPSAAGTPPINADKMTKVTLAAKLDAGVRPRVFIEKGTSASFQDRLAKALGANPDNFDNCEFGPDIQIISAK